MLMEHPVSGLDSLLTISCLILIGFVVYMAIFYPWKGDGGGSMG